MKHQQEDPLLGDLNRVLQYEVKFSGRFALSTVAPNCPNPGLDIDGIGRVALPLTEQVAELIMSTGEQAPYGRGVDTVMDTTVRDTIQIDASNVRFRNPKWTPAIQGLVEKEVWNGLGCAPFTTPPKCEFYKLLLYKPGAHFLPHQDTEKAPGMFATLVVTLPSEFTGGEIHVSHGGKSKVFDNAKDSAFETTVLAWYTDVTHEVKEITSGYRLALSYHLINTSPGIDPPHLPSSDTSLQSLRKIFAKWSRDEYPALDVNQAIAYNFIHEYSRTALRKFIVKGEDQHIASILKHAADLEGIVVLIGLLNFHVEGRTGDHGWQTYEGEGDSPEYGHGSYGTESSPVMSHVFETKVWMDYIQDVQGRETEISKIELAVENVLPYRAFSGVYPDDKTVAQGYFGNEGAGLDFVYRRAGLVMFPKEKQLSIMFSVEGSEEWALTELENSKSEGPTKENREIIVFLAQKRTVDRSTLLKIAVDWKDAEVWSDIVRAETMFFLDEKDYKTLCDGWELFKLDGVRETFKTLFQGGGSRQEENIKFLLFVKEKLPFGADPEEDEWISAQATSAVESYDLECDHSGLIDIVRWKGLEFASMVLPRFTNGSRMPLRHITAFGMGLIKYKEELIGLPQAEGQTSNAELFDNALDQLLAAAIPKLRHSEDCWELWVPDLLSICIPGKKSGPHKELLDCISDSCRPFYTRCVNIYSKVIPELIRLHGEHGVSVSSSPSGDFLRYVVGTYLQDVLGTEEGSPYLKFSTLTCGHEGCSVVNDFLRSEEREKTIPLNDEVNRCIGSLRIDSQFHILKREPHWWKNPPTVDLTKTREGLGAQYWSFRLANTRKLLEKIGTEEEICEIMGERWEDVKKALEGSQAFVVTEAGREKGADEEMDGIE